jgi:hypothetical protein
MICQHSGELLAEVLDEAQLAQAKEGIYQIALAGIQAFCLQDDRLRRRLLPLKN